MARAAHDRLRTFMYEQVSQRKAVVPAGDMRADAFTIMVKANQDESKYKLDDQELVRLAQTFRPKKLSSESQIGNTFIFLFAGQGMFSFIFMGPNI
jgi:cytochrome P450